jgi:octaprenyl-diphosphate synthase
VREGKVTLITLRLLEAFPKEVEAIFKRRAAEPGDIARLQELAVLSGADLEVTEAIAARVEQAIAALHGLPHSIYRDELESLAKRELVRVN